MFLSLPDYPYRVYEAGLYTDLKIAYGRTESMVQNIIFCS